MSWPGLIASLSLLTVQAPLVFPTSAEIVYVVASVTDGSGQPVRGLKAKDFTVREDGKPREVTTFASFADAAGAGAEWPVDFVMLLDTSGSMRGDLRRARRAAVEFAGSIPSVRGRNIVSFNSYFAKHDIHAYGRDVLKTLAGATGGLVVDGGARDLTTQFARIRNDLAAQYVLGFVPAPSSTGRAHKLKIGVASKGAKVRHRLAYETKTR